MKKLFFLPALAALFFASCSSDEPGGPASPEEQVGERYMAVKISNVGSAGSKAGGDQSTEEGNTFEEGVGNESSITAENIRFYFFTEDKRPFVMNMTGVNGEVSHTNMVKPTTITHTVTNGKVDEINGTLVLGTAAEGYKGNKPYYVICVANVNNNNVNFEDFAGLRMDNVRKVTANSPVPASWSIDGKVFLMASSSYLDADGSDVYYTKISDKIKTSASDAQNDPALIFLERLAAKVRVKGLGTYVAQKNKETGTGTENATYSIWTVENGTLEQTKNDLLDVELTGWQLRNTAKEAYVIKNLASTWTKDGANAPFENWNSATLHRCYWTDPFVASKADVDNSGYNIYETSQFKLGNFVSGVTNVTYCYENTLQPNTGNAFSLQSDRTSGATAIVVRGVVKEHGKTEGLNLCEWGGDFYTEDALKQVVIDDYNREKNEAGKLTADKVSFKEYSNNGSTITDARPNTWYAIVDGTTHNNYRFRNIKRWINGATSYCVNIQHIGEMFGVVRNHIYDYTMQAVIGLGVPGNDPDSPQPETESYLAARVNVLNWHVVSKTVTLE